MLTWVFDQKCFPLSIVYACMRVSRWFLQNKEKETKIKKKEKEEKEDVPHWELIRRFPFFSTTCSRYLKILIGYIDGTKFFTNSATIDSVYGTKWLSKLYLLICSSLQHRVLHIVGVKSRVFVFVFNWLCLFGHSGKFIIHKNVMVSKLKARSLT